MKRTAGVALAVVVLATAGFALASIASGANLIATLTGTTDTTTSATDTSPADTTETSTTSTVTTPGGDGRTVTVCHHTGSRKHPFHTITVSWHAVHAVTKHGGHVGACTADELGSPTNATPTGHHDQQGEGDQHTSTSPSQDGSTTQQPGQQPPGQQQPQSGHDSGEGQPSQGQQGQGQGQGHDNGDGGQAGGSSHHKGP